MVFKRKGLSKFVCGPYTIVRPSGRALGREKFGLFAGGHDYNVRLDEDQVWLMDAEREVAYANGHGARWSLQFGTHAVRLEQPKVGVNHTVFYEDEAIFAQTRAGGFPLKQAELIGADALNEDQRAFLVAISLLAWRESDRTMMSGGSPDSFPDSGSGGGSD